MVVEKKKENRALDVFKVNGDQDGWITPENIQSASATKGTEFTVCNSRPRGQNAMG